MEILTRRATKHDYPAYESFMQGLNNLHAEALPHIIRKIPLMRSENEYLALLVDAAQAIFIAEVNGASAGFVHALLRDAAAVPILTPRKIGYIDSIFILPQHRHTGLGQMLMLEAEAWCATQGANHLELNVYQFNQSAVKFYYELGYSPLSQHLIKNLTD